MKNKLELMNSIIRERILEVEKKYIKKGLSAVAEDIEQLRQEVKNQDIFNPIVETDNHQGVGAHHLAEISEILGYSVLGHYVFGAQAPDAGNIELLLHLKTQGRLPQIIEQEFLAPLIDGEIRSCFAMTEPDNAGSNPLLLQTKAVQDEHGHWILNGEKWFCTGADGAKFCLIMAVTDPTGPEYQRASIFFTPCDAEGFHLKENLNIMGHRGEGIETHSRLIFENLRIPDEFRLGEIGEGFKLAQSRLAHGRIHHCARWIGLSRRILDITLDRLKEREISSGQVLGQTQIQQAKLGELTAKWYAARLMVRDTAEVIEAKGTKEARVRISWVKFYVAQVFNEILDHAVQVQGGRGMTDETILSYLYRFERGARIYDGPDETHMLKAGKMVLKVGLDEALC